MVITTFIKKLHCIYYLASSVHSWFIGSRFSPNKVHVQVVQQFPELELKPRFRFMVLDELRPELCIQFRCSGLHSGFRTELWQAYSRCLRRCIKHIYEYKLKVYIQVKSPFYKVYIEIKLEMARTGTEKANGTYCHADLSCTINK
jgi:hypothetical protein